MARIKPIGEVAGRQTLAAEFALGVLDQAGRAEAAKLVETEPAFAADVANWQEQLLPMADAYKEVQPPRALRRQLEGRLFAGSALQPSWRDNKTAFWRGLAFATSLALLVSLGINARDMLFGTPQPGALVVSLESKDSAVRFLALYQPGDDAIRFNAVSGEAQVGKDYELWLIEGSNAPVSLGVMPDRGQVRIALPKNLAAKMVDGTTLAVSLEPLGGSPTGAATGPVVAVGTARSI